MPVDYYRSFPDTGASRSSFEIVFTGTFASGDALSDLTGGNLELTFYKINGLGNTGAPPGNTTPLFAHGAGYNFATFDDGVTDGQIREGSSAGNTINCTFGGFNMQDGIFCHVSILNSGTQIDSMSVTFF